MYEKVAFHAKVVVALGTSAVSVLKDEPQWKADRYRLVGLMVSSTWLTPTLVPTSASWDEHRSLFVRYRGRLTAGNGLSQPKHEAASCSSASSCSAAAMPKIP